MKRLLIISFLLILNFPVFANTNRICTLTSNADQFKPFSYAEMLAITDNKTGNLKAVSFNYFDKNKKRIPSKTYLYNISSFSKPNGVAIISGFGMNIITIKTENFNVYSGGQVVLDVLNTAYEFNLQNNHTGFVMLNEDNQQVSGLYFKISKLFNKIPSGIDLITRTKN